MKLIHVLLI